MEPRKPKIKTVQKWEPYQGYMTKAVKPMTKRHRREYPERDDVHLPLMKMCRSHPILGSKLFFHVENERKTTTYAQGAIRKAMGCKQGVSDLILLYPSKGFHGLVLELKAPGKRPTEPQSDFLQQAEAAGYLAKCYDNAELAYAMLIDYLTENA